MKEQYDKHVRDAIPYARNQLVWLSAKNIKSVQPSKKLTHLCYGPFRVVKKIGATSYKIAIPPYWKEKRVHDVFHADLLRPYVAPYFKNQVIEEPIKVPDVVEDNDQEDTEDYDVERVSDSKKWGRTVRYLVEYTGYGREFDEWKPLGALKDCLNKVAEFHIANPDKPRAKGAPTEIVEDDDSERGGNVTD
ncbi:unnamed protein product [Peniophora sp. CBMAI 1063]|nr:unnamed protein product [Peniophora sp. CBMAI 1063]